LESREAFPRTRRSFGHRLGAGVFKPFPEKTQDQDAPQPPSGRRVSFLTSWVFSSQPPTGAADVNNAEVKLSEAKP